MDSFGIKPNYAALGRKYEMDWRTVKKYHNGYQGKPATRNKGSKLDSYQAEIADKLTIKRITVRGVYEFMVKKYGLSRIGSYPNFNRYVIENKLKPKSNTDGHPRFEKGAGEQGQIDWKEDISIANRYGEIFIVNVLHFVLKFSRYSYLELSVQKRYDDVARGLINGFLKFGGVPKELLFDKEKEYLQPLPDQSLIDQYLTPTKYKVSEEALIRYGNSRYSVDPKLIGEEVTANLLDNKLYVYYKGKVAKTDMASVVTDNLEIRRRVNELK